MKFVVYRLVAPIINTNRGAPPCWSQRDPEAPGSKAVARSAAVSPETPLVTPYVVMAGGGGGGVGEGGGGGAGEHTTGRCNALV
jgi:hypothetical protein